MSTDLGNSYNSNNFSDDYLIFDPMHYSGCGGLSSFCSTFRSSRQIWRICNSGGSSSDFATLDSTHYGVREWIFPRGVSKVDKRESSGGSKIPGLKILYDWPL